MEPRWRDRKIVDSLLQALANEPDSKPTDLFRSPKQEIESCIVAILELPGLSEADRIHIANRALSELTKSAPPWRQEDLLGLVKNYANDFVNTPLRRYALVTNWSLRRGSLRGQYQIGQTFVSFSNKLTKDQQSAIENVRLKAAWSIRHPEPKQYSPVFAELQARSDTEAGDIALDAVDTIRAAISICILGNTWRYSEGRREPANKLLLGPFHHLLDHKNELVERVWFFEPDYIGERESIVLEKSDLSKLRRFLRLFVTRLSACPYQSTLQQAVCTYVRALDCANWTFSTIQLWSAIEMLTGTSSEKVDKVAERAASLWIKQRNRHLAVLRSLREARHLIVHQNRLMSTIEEQQLFQLKSYAENLILFHLMRGSEFGSFELAMHYLDQPKDMGLLKRRRQVLSSALKDMERMKKGRH